MSEEIIFTNSPEETREIGKKLAKEKKTGIYCLYGELGTGKTTFTQGFARGLGVSARIISPTFIILRTYKFDKGSFYHVDLYRVSQEEEIEELGISDFMKDKNNVFIVEWAEKMKKMLPKKRTDIYFESLEKDNRRIKIVTYE